MSDKKVYPKEGEDAAPEKEEVEAKEFSETACGCIAKTNPVRALMIKIIDAPPEDPQNKYFDMLITLFIVANTVVLCLPDTSVCTTYERCDFARNVLPTASNDLVEDTFNTVFLIEFVVKVIAMGFIMGPNAYLKDSWNILDFVVVVSSMLNYLPPEMISWLPNVRMLRTFRMLRPLKSVNKLPGLRKLVTAMLNSLPRLANVMVLLVFFLYLFSIIGLTFFMGVQNYRCRITEYPTQWPGPLVNAMSLEQANNCTTAHPCWGLYEELVLADPVTWKCADNDKECLWLINEEDERVCTPDGGFLPGEHFCGSTDSYEVSWCGSNWDDKEQPRFTWSDLPYGFPRMKSGTWVEGLNFGYTNFDNLFRAFVTIFQSVTMEGWVDVMYQVMDGFNGFITAAIFALLIIFGSNLVLNLVLAVITSAIEEVDDEEEVSDEEEKNEGDKDNDVGSHMLRKLRDGEEEDEVEDDSHVPAWRKPLRDIVISKAFTALIFAAIFGNTIVLSLDRYPMEYDQSTGLEGANELFTWFFIGELVIKMFALTPRYYFKDPFNNFDAFIVFVSVVEIILANANVVFDASAISALRAVRIFRVFKMAKEWHSLQLLLKNLKETIMEIGNFACLLGLFMLIFALVGMQLFAGKMHFDGNGIAVPFVTRYPMTISELENPDTGGSYSASGVVGCVAPECVDDGVTKYYFSSVTDKDGTIVPRIATPEEHFMYYHEADISRANFDDLRQSLVTIFQVLTGENWNAAMYDALRAVDDWIAFWFYFGLIVIGMFFVMNMFLAILLSKFEGNDEIVSAPTEGSSSSISHLKRKIRDTMTIVSMSKSPSKGDLASEYKVAPEGDAANGDKKQAKSLVDAANAMTNAHENVVEGAEDLVADITDKVNKAPSASDDNSLYIFSKASPLRQWCEKTVSYKHFDNSIIVVILISSLVLVIENPLNNPQNAAMQVLMVMNYIFTFIFTAEMCLKIIANGFMLNGPNSYLCGGWNRLDFIIVIIALLDVFKITIAGGALRTVRTIRVLRPIRMVSRKKELKLVVDALLTSIPQVVNVLIVCVLFFLIFSVIFVNFYKGTFMGCGLPDDMPRVGGQLMESPPQTYGGFEPAGQHFIHNFHAEDNTCFAKYYNTTEADQTTRRHECIDKGENSYYELQREGLDGSECITSRDLCECLGLEWEETTYQNFNDVMQALALLFEISTTEGWVDVMFAAADATSIHMQPKKNNQYHHVIFFIVFMLFGAFLFMNLFVGVIIERFNQIRDEMQASEGRTKIFMTPEQEEWSNTQQFILEKVKPKRKLRAKNASMFEIVQDPRLDKFIMACILLNSMVMGMNHFGADEGFLMLMQVLNLIFAAIFTLEFIIKYYAIGWTQYIREGWNQFDFVIVVLTALGIILDGVLKLGLGPVALIVRMVRMGRLFRLFNSAKTLKKLFNTIIASVPSLLNVCGLLSILMFVFAVLGLQMFATLPEGNEIWQHCNFRTFHDSLHVLFRFSTGENWNGVMHEMKVPGNLEKLRDDGVCDSTDPSDIKYPENDNWCGWGVTTDLQIAYPSGKGIVYHISPYPSWGFEKFDGTCTQEDADSGKFEHCCKELNGCADTYLLRFFFYMFTLTVTFVMLNLVIGIILDAFDGENQEDTSMLSEENLAVFVDDWAKFDEDATYCLKLSQLRDFFQLLDKPMGFGEEVVASDQQLLEHILALDLVIRESNVEAELGEIKFDIYDVASALGRRVCKEGKSSDQPIVLEPEEGGIPAYLRGVSHSPAGEVIRTFFEMTYNVRSEAGASCPAPAAATPPAAATEKQPPPPPQELAPVTGPGASKPAEPAEPAEQPAPTE